MNIIDAIARLLLRLPSSNRGAAREVPYEGGVIDIKPRKPLCEIPKRKVENLNRCPKCANKRAVQLCKAARDRMGL